MNPEQKAKELIEKFKPHSYYDAHDLATRRTREESNINSAKECAEICVDEIISQLQQASADYYPMKELITYWQSVKEHIQKA